MRRFALLTAGLAIGLMIGYGAVQVAQRNRPITYRGTLVDPPLPAYDFSLVAAGDAEVRLSDFQGKLVLLYFGYTFCPDVCPATLTDLAKVQRAVDDGGEQLQVIMVTIDPERDTPDLLADYVSHFHPTFIGLSGPPDEITETAGAYGIYFEAQPGSAESGYLMDHTASVILLDRDGQTRLLYSFGTPADDIAADVRQLLKRSS